MKYRRSADVPFQRAMKRGRPGERPLSMDLSSGEALDGDV